MRIFLVETVPQMGGAQRTMLEYAVELQKKGGTILAAAAEGPLSQALQAAGIPVALIPCYRQRRNPLCGHGVVRRLRVSAALRRAAASFMPDVIHANSLESGRVAAPLAAKYPMVCHVRDVALPGATLRLVAARAARLVACSAAVEARLAELLRGVPRGKVVRVVNGIDTERFAAASLAAASQSLGLPHNCRVVTMAAHLVPWKRHDLFLKMAAMLLPTRPDLHFIIAGRDLLHEHGLYRRRLHAQARRLGLSRKLLWLEDSDDIGAALCATTVLAHTAASEPFGRVLCEAMALAKPVVAVRGMGPAAIVSHNLTGLLVDAPDAGLLSAAVGRLLDNPALAAAFGRAGQERVQTEFSIRRSAREMLEVYRSAIAGHASS